MIVEPYGEADKVEGGVEADVKVVVAGWGVGVDGDCTAVDDDFAGQPGLSQPGVADWWAVELTVGLAVGTDKMVEDGVAVGWGVDCLPVEGQLNLSVGVSFGRINVIAQ